MPGTHKEIVERLDRNRGKIEKMIASGAEKGRKDCDAHFLQPQYDSNNERYFTGQLNLEPCRKQADGSLSTPEQRGACEDGLKRHYELCVQSVFKGKAKALAELDSLFATNAGKTLVPGKR